VIVTRVKLLNYRNLGHVSLEISPKINIFLGRNGQGKTNLLEGLSYLSLGRSHRGARDRELIRFGADHLHLEVEGRDAQGADFHLEAALTRDGRKRIKLDGAPIERNSDLVGRLSTVLFDPSEIELAKGSPDGRRRFLDLTLSLVSAEYFRNLMAYRRALSQKNRLLKDRHSHRGEELGVWDEELVRFGTPLILARNQVVSALEEASSRAYSGLAEGGGRLRMGFSLSLGESVPERDELDDPQAWSRAFHRALQENRRRERNLGYSLIGPHRDRLELELHGRSLRRYGSQGEMRSAAIALKLGQAELIYERTRERPVVLLDDIFSELDLRRTEALQALLHREHQLFIATARADDVAVMRDWEDVRVWTVNAGRVTPLSDWDRLGDFVDEDPPEEEA
jgi:DNA replication and repair protein RecF